MIILDTNVLSEALRVAPSRAVAAWLAAQQPLAVFTTAITQAELLCGVEVLPVGKRRQTLASALDALLSDVFQGRILPFDAESARLFPKIVTSRAALGRPISQFDAMIAAIAKSRKSAIATRNTSDFEHCGVRIVNPWTD